MCIITSHLPVKDAILICKAVPFPTSVYENLTKILPVDTLLAEDCVKL